jgi:hypothetical protein
MYILLYCNTCIVTRDRWIIGALGQSYGFLTYNNHASFVVG